MEQAEFLRDLLNTVKTRAEVDNDYLASAFFNEVADRLADAEEVEQLLPAHFVGVGDRGRRLAVDGYDLGDDDGSVALAVMSLSSSFGSASPQTLTQADAKKALTSLENYLQEAVDGRFEADREESTPEYQLARSLRERGRSVTRYRLYLLTDATMSGRAKALVAGELNGIRVEYHIWDVARLLQVFNSVEGREELEIDLREWSPSGIPALRTKGTSTQLETYLMSMPGGLLADLYGRYGSRLLESNVRSYLSVRGGVNKGIRNTLIGEPATFLAYNNGVTATATGVTLSADRSSIVSIKDLQIVNGGQTTASLFYVRRDPKTRVDYTDVFVQAKLVVVDPAQAVEMVPRISRYANSQNRVSEADFFSNSPFHVRMEQLSRRILAPAQAGVNYQTKWFYERTRGQYLNEQGKLSSSEMRAFTHTYPRLQVITKTDAARYESSWGQKPHLVSSGAQKNFMAFAESVSKRWEDSPDEFNEVFYKHLVAKAILYGALRRAVSKADWYESGYLANIVTYALAKLSYEVGTQAPGYRFDFDAIWQAQGVDDGVTRALVDLGRLCASVLTDPRRPIANVTEWAKREACWEAVRAARWELPTPIATALTSTTVVREKKKAAKSNQRIDSGIEAQARVLAIGAEGWKSVSSFAASRNVSTEMERGVLAVAASGRLPSEKQAGVLLRLLDRVSELGFKELG